MIDVFFKITSLFTDGGGATYRNLTRKWNRVEQDITEWNRVAVYKWWWGNNVHDEMSEASSTEYTMIEHIGRDALFAMMVGLLTQPLALTWG